MPTADSGVSARPAAACGRVIGRPFPAAATRLACMYQLTSIIRICIRHYSSFACYLQVNDDRLKHIVRRNPTLRRIKIGMAKNLDDDVLYNLAETPLLAELELVNLLLEIHNPATYDPTENEANGTSLVDKRITAEVGALLHALELGSYSAINSHIVAEQARKAGATSKLGL